MNRIKPSPIKKITYPTKKQIEELLGKQVVVELFDKDVLMGRLETNKEKTNYYYLLSEKNEIIKHVTFRISHIHKVEAIENE